MDAIQCDRVLVPQERCWVGLADVHIRARFWEVVVIKHAPSMGIVRRHGDEAV